MKIAICEDVLQEAEWLRDTIQKWLCDKKYHAEIFIYQDAEAFRFAMEDHSFDMLFLDIKMPGEDGMTLAKRLRRKGDFVPIVFVTGEREYVIEGYEVEAVHYLIKPVAAESVFQCLERIWMKRSRQEAYLILETEAGVCRVKQQEIYMIEGFGRKLKYYTRQGEFIRIGSLKDAQKELEENCFVTCYRGIIINLLYVEKITKEALRLLDSQTDFEKEVPVSRRLYQKVNEAFIQYYKS